MKDHLYYPESLQSYLSEQDDRYFEFKKIYPEGTREDFLKSEFEHFNSLIHNLTLETKIVTSTDNMNRNIIRAVQFHHVAGYDNLDLLDEKGERDEIRINTLNMVFNKVKDSVENQLKVLDVYWQDIFEGNGYFIKKGEQSYKDPHQTLRMLDVQMRKLLGSQVNETHLSVSFKRPVEEQSSSLACKPIISYRSLDKLFTEHQSYLNFTNRLRVNNVIDKDGKFVRIESERVTNLQFTFGIGACLQIFGFLKSDISDKKEVASAINEYFGLRYAKGKYYDVYRTLSEAHVFKTRRDSLGDEQRRKGDVMHEKGSHHLTHLSYLDLGNL